MTWGQVGLLAIIQGLTEFFPVSSSGHLVLLQHLLGLKEPQVLFDALLHVGTAVALIIYLRHELLLLVKAFFRLGRKSLSASDQAARRLLFHLIIATIPIVMVGYWGSDFFEKLFLSPRSVSFALGGTAFFLFLTKNTQPRSHEENTWQAVVIGVFQAAAIIPGLSRSGLTIGSGLLLGIQRERAARFSYLLSLPAIIGATVFQWVKQGGLTGDNGLIVYLAGLVLAAGVGYLALVYLTRLVKEGKFYLFSFYCLLMAGLAFLVSIW